jgi:hypothetical protein
MRDGCRMCFLIMDNLKVARKSSLVKEFLRLPSFLNDPFTDPLADDRRLVLRLRSDLGEYSSSSWKRKANLTWAVNCRRICRSVRNIEKSFLVNDQRDAQIILYLFISIYNSLHVSNTSCSSSGETNCINTASGNSHSMLVAEMCSGWKKSSSNLHTSRPPT